MSAIVEPLVLLVEKPVVRMPVPCGHQIMIRMPEVKEKHGSVYIPQSRVLDERIAGIVAEVVAMGSDCYTGLDSRGNGFYPNGPYCKVGDFVMMNTYSGVRCQVGPDTASKEYRFIDEQAVIAVVPDPSMVRRDI